METVELACEKRETRPKGRAGALRRAGRVPAILYRPRTAPTPLIVGGLELRARVASAARSPVMRLESPSPEIDGKHVILKDVQRGPVTGEIVHADLYEVHLNRALKVSVPLKFTGRAVGVTEAEFSSRSFATSMWSVCRWRFPKLLKWTFRRSEFTTSIHVSALKFPGNIKPIFDSDFGVVSVLPPTVEEAPVAAAAAAVEGAPVEGAVPAEEPRRSRSRAGRRSGEGGRSARSSGRGRQEGRRCAEEIAIVFSFPLPAFREGGHAVRSAGRGG